MCVRNTSKHARGWAVAVVLVAVGVALSGWVAARLHGDEVSRLEDRFEQIVANRTDRLLQRLLSYESALLAERAAFELSPTMDLAAFRRLYASLDIEDHQPGMQGLGWQVRVARSELDAFVSAAREQRPGFTIEPEGARDEYYIVLYNEPADQLGATWGLDAREDSTIRPFLERAIDCACTTLSAPAVLGVDLVVAETERPVTFDMFVPVYRPGAAVATVEQRRREFLGWASSPFRAQDFLDSLAIKGPQIGMRLIDQATGTALGAYPATTRGTTEAVRTVEFGGRTWLIEYYRLAQFPAANTLTAWIIFLGGSIVWTAVGAGLHHAVDRTRRALHGAAVANELALTDPLTGLPNRRALFAWLDPKTVHSGLTVFFIDLDGLKATNDLHGHDAGDRMLLEAAARLSRCIRPGDLLARIGGDEFIVIAPQVVEQVTAEKLYERLAQSLIGGSTTPIEASIGTATGPAPGETIEQLIARADKEMYLVKAERRLRHDPEGSPSGVGSPSRWSIRTTA